MAETDRAERGETSSSLAEGAGRNAKGPTGPVANSSDNDRLIGG